MGVAVRHQFVGALGRRVEADRQVDRVGFGERQAGIAAIDAGAAGEQQVLDLAVATAFQDMGEAGQIRIGVGERRGDRITDAGLGSQMDDDVEFALGDIFDQARVDQVLIDELEALELAELIEPGLLQAGIVVVVQIVHPGDGMAFAKQALADKHADKTGGSGDQDFHLFVLWGRGALCGAGWRASFNSDWRRR